MVVSIRSDSSIGLRMKLMVRPRVCSPTGSFLTMAIAYICFFVIKKSEQNGYLGQHEYAGPSRRGDLSQSGEDMCMHDIYIYIFPNSVSLESSDGGKQNKIE